MLAYFSMAFSIPVAISLRDDSPINHLSLWGLQIQPFYLPFFLHSSLLKGYSMFDIQHSRLVLRCRPHRHFYLLHFACEKSPSESQRPHKNMHFEGVLFKLEAKRPLKYLIYPLNGQVVLVCQDGKNDDILRPGLLLWISVSET